MGLWSPNLDDLKQLPATLDLNQELRKACSTNPDTSGSCTSISAEESDYDIDAEDFPVFMHATINRLIEQCYYDYLRSCAPQDPRDRRTKSSHSSDQSAHGKMVKDPRGTNALKRHRKRQLGRSTGDDQDSEDENEDLHHGTQPSNSESRRIIACPFFRREPLENRKKCNKTMTKIGHLKSHLRRVHYTEYCETCFQVLSKTLSSTHLMCHPQQEPTGFFTKAKLAEINKHAGRKRFEEQWRHLYEVLFPGEPVNFDPYLLDSTSQTMKNLEHFVLSGEAQAKLRKALEFEGYEGENFDKILRAVTLTYMPEVLPRLLPPPTFPGNIYSTKAKDSIQSSHEDSDLADQHPDIIPDMVNASKLQDVHINVALQPLDDSAGAYIHLGLKMDERTESHTLALDEPQTMGVVNGWPIQDASEVGNDAISEFDFDSWVQPGDYFQPPTDAELLHMEEQLRAFKSNEEQMV
jgi:hypothetical protein